MTERDFRVARTTREHLGLDRPLFVTSGNLQTLYNDANGISYAYNRYIKEKGEADSSYLSAGKVHATAVLHMLYQSVLDTYLRENNPDMFTRILPLVERQEPLKAVLTFFDHELPSPLLRQQLVDRAYYDLEVLRSFFIHQVLTNNPALMSAAGVLVEPQGLVFPKEAGALQSLIGSYTRTIDGKIGHSDEDDIFDFLTKPARLYPNSLSEQIQYILREWADLLSDELKLLLQSGLDFIHQEEKDHGGFGNGGGAPMEVPDYSGLDNEYEAFSNDLDWMPRVVMIAKCTLVWLDQLSKWYHRPIRTLDQIPDEELDKLAERGFTALWLIGLWERSDASKRIKVMCGNPDAEASAYSLKNYEIAQNIGGWPALENLRDRCARRGIRLASDMVPNHTGLDSDWMYQHPEYFMSQDYSPFPSYTFNGPDLSTNPDVEIKLEDHYYDRSDAAVTFRRIDRRTGETRYVFHGNDGTSMPWNDTAQLDYLNPVTREAVIQEILHVARNFHIIRFDAAMTLAKRHIQRLWYPKPGNGGDIAGRFMYALSDEEFNRRIPQEFWREVVDRIAKEVPDTLLLAEAFWMMEGYFVRTLGMHRVYNSAFMNMLKNQENQKYRMAIKNTLVFEPEILKRYVNFMNNPDEETAIAQFGDGNRYFSICTILATLPGLPMFGHGQIEGLKEKYGMEYRRAYWDEKPNQWMIDEHYRRIFPLLRRRYLFSGVEHFNIYDAWNNGVCQESIFAYVNGHGSERTLVIVNNQYERVSANIKMSCPKLKKDGEDKETVCIPIAENLGLHFGGRHYMIWENFSTGLTYLMPSIRLFEEGYNFTIDGYDSRVLWNIREVEDFDGSYEKLYGFLGDGGVKNINVAVMLLRLKPVYRELEPFRTSQFFSYIDDMLFLEDNAVSERKLLLMIAETYTRLNAVSETFDEALVEALPQLPRDVDPGQMVAQIRALNRAFHKNADGVFASFARLTPELGLVIAAAIVLKPFIDEEKASVKDAMKAADRLLLQHFFEGKKEELHLKDEDIHQLMHMAALFCVAGYRMKASVNRKPEKILASLLEDEDVRIATRCNEYQGITWYNKEMMQLLIVLSALSVEVMLPEKGRFNSERYIARLLEKEEASQYKLDRLLEV